jgi:hypothetical protein
MSWVIILPALFLMACTGKIPGDENIDFAKFSMIWGGIFTALSVGIMIGWMFTATIGDTLGATIALGSMGVFWFIVGAAIALYETGKKNARK